MFSVHRNTHNPIVQPEERHPWMEYAAFNGTPVRTPKEQLLVFRAMDKPKAFESTTFSLSTIGRAVRSRKGDYVRAEQFIAPQEAWERFGCEDPRVTKLGDTYYIFYTALGSFPYRPSQIRVAVALSKDMKTIEERHLVTPFNAKAMSLFPEKIGGKFTAIFAAHTDEPPSKICIAQFEREEELWSPEFWKNWHENIDTHTLNIPKRDDDQIEVGAAPIKTKYGWLLVYSHIQKYYQSDKIFGIEAVLLDLDNPLKVIAKTRSPIFVPEEQYEKKGNVDNIVFPSGAELVKNTLHIFYGAADTSCAEAKVDFMGVLAHMDVFHDQKGLLKAVQNERKSRTFARVAANPVLKPLKDNAWEASAVFNPTAIDLNNTIHILYRAMSFDNTSTVGYAASKNGVTISRRLSTPIYTPRAGFEGKNVPNGNSGCEDPRITEIGTRIYMCYTAFNGTNSPAVALSSILTKDFVQGQWNWSDPIIVTKDNVDDKDACVFPAKVQGKYALIHRVNHRIVIDYSSSLTFENRNSFEDRLILGPRSGMWDSKKVGLAMTPIKVPAGWLMLYHGIKDSGYYCVGATLLDAKNPEKVIARTNAAIFEPETDYELKGQVGNVVFPCGAVIRKGTIYIYYGGADSVVGIATMKLATLMKMLKW